MMRDAMDDDVEQPVRNRVTAVITLLRNTLRSLGFSEFTPDDGEQFDPRCMICDGYAEGTAGEVITCVRPGYRAEDKVVRPAGVVMARAEDEETCKEDSDE